MKRFIIVYSEGSESQNETLTKVLRLVGLETWHWIPALWLVAGEVTLTSAELHDKIRPFVGLGHIAVFDFDTREQSGRYPADAVPWLRDVWDKAEAGKFNVVVKNVSSSKGLLKDAT